MNSKDSPCENQKKAYSSYHEDGIIDILIASYLLFIGLLMFFNFAYAAPFAALLYIIIYRGLKMKFTVPRSSLLKFSENRLMIVVFLLAIVFALPLIILPMLGLEALIPMRLFIIDYILLLGGLIGAVLFSVLALAFRIKRLHTYGLITLGFFTVGYLLNLPVAVLLLVLGVWVLCYGAVKLRSFIKKY